MGIAADLNENGAALTEAATADKSEVLDVNEVTAEDVELDVKRFESVVEADVVDTSSD
jgi:hypothetical protein